MTKGDPDPFNLPDDSLDPRTPGPDGLEHSLSEAGRLLRDNARTIHGTEVIAASARRKLIHSQRTNWVLAAVAALTLVGMIGTVVWDGSSGKSEGADSSAMSTSDAAVKLVDSLPEEPLDPHSAKLIAAVKNYNSCDALLGDLRRIGAEHVGSAGFGGTSIGLTATAGYGSRDSLTNRAADMASVPQGAASFDEGNETLGTNVIVEGVDEPDTVKASGSLVVEVAGRDLRIVDTKAPGIVGQVTIGRFQKDSNAMPESLILDGTKAVVFGTEYVSAEAFPGDPSASRPGTRYTTVTFVDLSTPSKPTVTQSVRIEGSRVAVRRVGTQIRMVTASTLSDLPMVSPLTPNAVAPALRQNRLAVAQSSVDDWIPAWDEGEGTEAHRLMDCSGVVVPDTFAGVEMTSLVQFDLAGPFNPTAVGMLAPSEDITATANDVVVASHVWVDPIDQTDDFENWSTAIHRFTFDKDGPTYVGSGAVDGSVRDDFSMSVLEDGTVAVVTADVLPWKDSANAKVTVRLLAYEEGSKKLVEVGSLVPKESDQALGGVRFVGNKLILSSGLGGAVFSVVDLSDHSTPRDIGSVPVPALSPYIHPLGQDRVLVVGYAIRTVVRRQHSDLVVSLVDISGTPKVVADWTGLDLNTAVGYDHHSFTWWASHSSAAFGVSHNSVNAYDPPDALFLTLDGNSISPRLVSPREADLGRKCPPEQVDRRGCDDSGPPYVNRVLVVNGAPWLYTSESLERLDPQTYRSTGIVALPRVG